MTRLARIVARLDNSSSQTHMPPERERFIRFLDPPRGGRSMNHLTGRKEPGLSVYRAVAAGEGAFRIDDDSNPAAANQYLEQEVPIYLMEGDQIGLGADYEPVIANYRVVARLVYDSDSETFSPESGQDAGRLGRIADRIVARLDNSPHDILERLRLGVADGPRHDEVLAWYNPVEGRVQVTMLPEIGGRDRDLQSREIVNNLRRWGGLPVEWINVDDAPGAGWLPVTPRTVERG